MSDGIREGCGVDILRDCPWPGATAARGAVWPRRNRAWVNADSAREGVRGPIEGIERIIELKDCCRESGLKTRGARNLPTAEYMAHQTLLIPIKGQVVDVVDHQNLRPAEAGRTIICAKIVRVVRRAAAVGGIVSQRFDPGVCHTEV